MAEKRADLLVADFDPAQHGATAFFNRAKSSAPDLRVLIIAAEDAGRIAHEPNGPAAFNFIRKPFEVEAFGAAVRKLLVDGGGGCLRELRLIDLLVLHAAAGASAFLLVDAADGRSGEIHFTEGRLSHALAMGKRGVLGLQEMLRWRSARVREIERRVDPPRSVRGAWTVVLVDALRATAIDDPLPPPEVAPEPAMLPPVAKQKILVIDDTETLLIFVEEILSGSNPATKIVTASSGTRGLEMAAAEKPDLILLDYSLPDMTGEDVCRRLLESEVTARVPVVMMSGHVPEMLSVAERFDNVVASIAKPFLSTALIELVDQTLADLPKLIARRRKNAKPPPAATAPKTKAGNGDGRRLRNGGTKPALPLPPVPTPSVPARAAILPEPPIAPPLATAAPPEARPEPPTPPAQTQLVESAHLVPLSQPTAPTRVAAAMQPGTANAVVLTLSLEVLSIQFSTALQIKAIRARPFAHVVSLHILPSAAPGSVVREASFDLLRVQLDARGQIDTIHVAPTSGRIEHVRAEKAVSVAGISLLPPERGATLEVIPAPPAGMQIQLTALFDLAGVELSPGFGVGHLVLRWRRGKMHVSLQREAAQSGITFETAQILLDRSARIAEILLDAMA